MHIDANICFWKVLLILPSSCFIIANFVEAEYTQSDKSEYTQSVKKIIIQDNQEVQYKEVPYYKDVHTWI